MGVKVVLFSKYEFALIAFKFFLFYVIHPWIELSKKSDPVFFFQGMEKLSLNVGVKSSQVHQPTCFWKSGGDPV